MPLHPVDFVVSCNRCRDPQKMWRVPPTSCNDTIGRLIARRGRLSLIIPFGNWRSLRSATPRRLVFVVTTWVAPVDVVIAAVGD